MNINNPKILSLTDGSAGMLSQTKGLAFELSNDVTEIKTNIVFPWNKIQPGILPVFSWIFKNQIPSISPDIAISCGRKSVYLSLYLKRKFPNLINIHIQNPKISSKKFSFVIAPNHDNIKGDNIINSVGAIHHFKINGKTKYKFNTISENLITFILGGENNHYIFSVKEAEILCNKIEILKKKYAKFKFFLITSRRTSNEVKYYLKKNLDNMAQMWLGDGENPYEYCLYNSRYFIITSDSTSMISEASISGMPIYVYHLPYKRKSIRLNRFHEEFRKLNITRDFLSTNTLDSWSYNKLNESKRIAGIIKKRIIEVTNESR